MIAPNFANISDQCIAYDLLPPQLRKAIAEAPIKISAVHVLSTWQLYGTPETLCMVQRQIEAVMIALEQTRGAA